MYHMHDCCYTMATTSLPPRVCSRVRGDGAQGARVHTMSQVCVPAGLRGACFGRLTPSELQSRFGGKALQFQVICPQLSPKRDCSSKRVKGLGIWRESRGESRRARAKQDDGNPTMWYFYIFALPLLPYHAFYHSVPRALELSALWQPRHNSSTASIDVYF